MGHLRKVLSFLAGRKRYWLVPIIVVLIIALILIIIGSSVLEPFGYTLY